jgi:transcriptional regulator with XRE-family HTH domain
MRYLQHIRVNLTTYKKSYMLYIMAIYSVNDIIVQLREARKSQGLSQIEMGKRLGVTQSQITRIERGASDIRLSTLVETAHALGLEPVLIPKPLLPAVRHLLAKQKGGIEPTLTTPPRRLLGSEPEDSDAEVG